MKSRSSKKSLRETRLINQEAHNYYGKLYGKPPMIDEQVKPKREIVNHTDKDQLEAAVVTECGEVLRRHPRIRLIVRQQGGMMYNSSGAPVYFYRITRSPTEMRVSDFWGFTIDKKYYAFECKWRGWTKPKNQREREQEAFLTMVQNSGGIGRFVTCAEDVLEALK